VKVDGRQQVIPFRTQTIKAVTPLNDDDSATPLLQQYQS